MSKESRAARKAANQARRDADAALHANQRKEKKADIRDETPEYLRLNDAANAAAKQASWWRR